MTMETVPVLLLAGLDESVPFTTTVEVPGVVGVPVSEQLAFNVRPAGRFPLMSEQVYGPLPPVTPMLPVYGVPAVPAGGELSVRVTDAGLMVIDSGPVVVFDGLAESVTFTITVCVPAVVGVPETTQLLPSVRPAGRDPDAIEQL
jgi:hypothetical protein